MANYKTIQDDSALSYDEELDVLEKTLEKIGNKEWWLWFLFLIASTPGMFNAAHIMSYVFLSHTPTHWCHIDELVAANWTNEEIIHVSTPGGNKKISSCFYYKWDYNYLVQLGYKKAMKFTIVTPKPTLVACDRYSYDEPVPKSSIVSEWDLVCERSTQHSYAQVSIAAGKFTGGFVFGFLADKFGRKISFIISSFLYIISGPAAAITNTYLFFIITRFFIGIAASGVYQSAYTIMTEIAVKKRRTFFSCAFSISYPLGFIMLSLTALQFQSWRSLQFAISIPALVLLFHCWFLPESPRWLLSQGKRSSAWRILRRINKSLVPAKLFNNVDRILEENNNNSGIRFRQKLLGSMNKLSSIFKTTELRHRIFICYITWFVVGLSYYIIALNADNFTVNRYVYVALNGVAEAPANMLSLLLLSWFGRKTTSSVLFLVSGTALISILSIPQDEKGTILLVALFGKFCIAAVSAVIMLFTSELFPTSIRNSVIGTSITMSQLGSMGAPYIVEVLGSYGWYIPSTISGSLSLLTGFLILLLPETKDKPLMDTVHDLKSSQHQDRVSIRNCCYSSL